MTGPHGLDCRTLTVRIRCRECEVPAYLFRCNHGSVVLFDALGGSWPEHDCDLSWGRGLERRTGEDGETVVEVAPGVEVHRAPRREEFRPRPDDAVIDVTRRPSSAPDVPIVRMDPPPTLTGVHTIAGRLTEIVRDRDAYADLGLEPGTVGASLLPVPGDCDQITVHCVAEDDMDAIESFTGFVAGDVLREVARGDAVIVDLVAGRGADGQVVWCVDDLFCL